MHLCARFHPAWFLTVNTILLVVALRSTRQIVSWNFPGLVSKLPSRGFPTDAESSACFVVSVIGWIPLFWLQTDKSCVPVAGIDTGPLQYSLSNNRQTDKRGNDFFRRTANRLNAFSSQSCFSYSWPLMIHSLHSDKLKPLPQTSFAYNTYGSYT